jgi:ABC-2 type transport system ATP-binding protein/lipopolysaccharide transport system ATP-binding protein
MTHIVLSNVDLELPVFTARSRGLLNTILAAANHERARLERTGLFKAKVHALRGLNLRVVSGERIGLLGINGSGKTTLLKVLSGAYEPTGGVADISGSIASLTDLMVGLDSEASGYENVRIKNRHLGGSKADFNKLLEDVRSFSELGPYLDLPVRTYSSGMVLRLAVALSTTKGADIVLMDEMIGVGDARFVAKTEARLRTIMTHSAILVIASHNVQILQTFCTRGLVMSEGSVEYDGDIESAISHYYSSIK